MLSSEGSRPGKIGLTVLTTWPEIAPNTPFLSDDVAQGTQIGVTKEVVRSEWRNLMPASRATRKLCPGWTLNDAGPKSARGKSVSVVINPYPSAFESSA